MNNFPTGRNIGDQSPPSPTESSDSPPEMPPELANWLRAGQESGAHDPAGQVRAGQGMQGLLQQIWDRGTHLVQDHLEQMRPLDISAAFLQELPRDIELLSQLARKEGEHLPPLFEEFMQSQGYGHFGMICSESATLISRLEIIRKLDERLKADQPAVEPSSSALMRMINNTTDATWRMVNLRNLQHLMVSACLENMLSIGSMLLKQSPDAATHRLLLMAREAASLYIHYHVYTKIGETRRQLDTIADTNSLAATPVGTTAWARQLGHGQAAEKARREAYANFWKQDLPNTMMGYINYILANSTIREATR